MTLQELLDRAMQHQLIKETRMKPMRTAISAVCGDVRCGPGRVPARGL